MKRVFLLTVSSLAFTAGAQTERPADNPNTNEPNAHVMVFKAAKPIVTKPRRDFYPASEARTGREAWQYLNMMIDPQGKPYEITVVDSNGNDKLDSAAIAWVSSWKFEPATDDGKPIHSSFSTRMMFRLNGSSGARKEFVTMYQKFGAEISANERENAAATLAAMRTERLYEDAYFNFARYIYAAKWGTVIEQIEALRRAIAYENQDRLLPPEMHKAALAALLPLQARTNDFSGALVTWQTLQELKITDSEKQEFKAIIEQIEALRSSNGLIAVPGEISSHSSWHITLFKRKFQLDVSTGKIEEIKLRCEKKYIFFPFNAEMSYEISPTAGTCHLELIGSPGTKFNLLQS